MCRTPSGVRGLKLNVLVVDFADKIASHPVRGAWIEIYNQCAITRFVAGRTPSGVRGLKL